jgi:hypothetical protein
MESIFKNLDIFKDEQFTAHELEVLIEEGSVTTLKIIDHFESNSEIIFLSKFKRAGDKFKIIQVEPKFKIDGIANDSIPLEESVNGEVAEKAINQLVNQHEFIAMFGFPNGIGATNGHKSMTTYTTEDGTYYRSYKGEEPIRLILMDKRTLHVKSVFSYQFNLKLRDIVPFDIHSIIEDYASSLENAFNPYKSKSHINHLKLLNL